MSEVRGNDAQRRLVEVLGSGLRTAKANGGRTRRRQGLRVRVGPGGPARLVAAPQLQRRNVAAQDHHRPRELLPPLASRPLALGRACTQPARHAHSLYTTHADLQARAACCRRGAHRPTGWNRPVPALLATGTCNRFSPGWESRAAVTRFSPSRPNRWNRPRTGDLSTWPRNGFSGPMRWAMNGSWRAHRDREPAPLHSEADQIGGGHPWSGWTQWPTQGQSIYWPLGSTDQSGSRKHFRAGQAKVVVGRPRGPDPVT